MLRHPVKNNAGMKGGAFDGCEQLVLRRVGQLPAERDATELRAGAERDAAAVREKARSERERARAELGELLARIAPPEPED